MFTPASYEPEAVAAMKAWFAETSRPAYACGPLLPTASESAANATEKAQSSESDKIQAFLDGTLETSGKRSALYVSRIIDDVRMLSLIPIYISCRYHSDRSSGL